MQNKKTATVKVYCQYLEASGIFYFGMHDTVLYLAKNQKSSNSKTDKYQYKRTVHYDKKIESYPTTKTITFDMKKVSNKWKISKFTKAISNAIHCNYQTAYDKYFK